MQISRLNDKITPSKRTDDENFMDSKSFNDFLPSQNHSLYFVKIWNEHFPNVKVQKKIDCSESF